MKSQGVSLSVQPVFNYLVYADCLRVTCMAGFREKIDAVEYLEAYGNEEWVVCDILGEEITD